MKLQPPDGISSIVSLIGFDGVCFFTDTGDGLRRSSHTSLPLSNRQCRFPCRNYVNYSADISVAAAEDDQNGLLAKADNDTNFVSLNIEETMAVLTRCSFDESHRQPIFLLGGVPAIAELIKVSPDQRNQQNNIDLKPFLTKYCHFFTLDGVTFDVTTFRTFSLNLQKH